VTLRDIMSWLAQTLLAEGQFAARAARAARAAHAARAVRAARADGTRRVAT